MTINSESYVTISLYSFIIFVMHEKYTLQNRRVCDDLLGPRAVPKNVIAVPECGSIRSIISTITPDHSSRSTSSMYVCWSEVTGCTCTCPMASLFVAVDCYVAIFCFWKQNRTGVLTWPPETTELKKCFQRHWRALGG